MNTKAIFASLIVLMIFAACKQLIDTPTPWPDPDQGCDFYNQQPSWVVEDFKTDYTIRFTPDYTGKMIGFEGNFFNKTKTDSSIALYYAYCGPLFCEDFGDSLNAPLPNSLDIPNYRSLGGTVLASNSHTIFEVCDSTNILGVLYFTDATGPGVANFYLGDPSIKVKEALAIEYGSGDLPELVAILGTIEEN
ncbi:MAG: hypothetical protein AB8H47_21850 [Bacteroidia bacterium]